MNLFRWFGWLLLFAGAGFFVGEVYELTLFLLGFALIVFNPIYKSINKSVNGDKKE